ncbi:hypothetical protein [Acidianus sp. HS-5]|uniref:hypothetical protein n=1 Tax=Acidianus sp. HS-5 TaxID=2886040 RepID=UPI001F3BD967|nr:hypothetical protein [Acidianus sp. HS-5]
MNKISIIIGVIAVIVVGAILGIFLIYHSTTHSTSTKAPLTTSPSPTTTPPTTTPPKSHVTGAVSLTV